MLPMWETQMHNHESEVISECISNEEPRARKILKRKVSSHVGFGLETYLEPDLGFISTISV
jgi:hypothetical protein